MNMQQVRVGVLGATGYTGQELLRILQRHPAVSVMFATSEGDAGTPVPGFPLRYVTAEEAPLADPDVVFLCLPHGAAGAFADRAVTAGTRVVDLTADHRPGSGREDRAVYGLADRSGAAVKGARLVANPGCYPTGVLLALLPLVEAGLLEAERPVVVNAASGVTGAGRSPKRALLYAEIHGDYRAYSLGNEHRHLNEMRALLPGVPLVFQPHLLPVPRGILETIYAPVAGHHDAADLRAAWHRTYADAPTVRVLDEGVPALRDVVGTDVLVLGVADNHRVPGVATIVAALDNLGKGAAGQAVHNMNLMFGLPPTAGLRLAP